MSKLSETLIEKLQHSDDWTFDEYKARHDPSRLEIWIANGVLFVSLRGYMPVFSLREKYRLWRAVKKALEQKLINQLNKDTK